MNEIREQPQFLYHYTSINTLAYILKNREFKFTSLPMLDDQEEAEIADANMLSKYCFVSSWTENSQESIPMWEMYSKGMSGIRIKLPTNIFVRYPISINEFIDEHERILKKECPNLQFARSNSSNGGEAFQYSPVPIKTFFEENVNFLPASGPDVELFEVFYTNDESLLRPRIISRKKEDENNGTKSVAFSGLLGVCKRDVWNFQKEWRYRLIIFPGNHAEMFPTNNGEEPDYFERVYAQCPDLYLFNSPNTILDKYFLSFRPEVLAKIEIVMGPKTNEADRLIVEALCEKYIPGADMESIIKNSILKIRK